MGERPVWGLCIFLKKIRMKNSYECFANEWQLFWGLCFKFHSSKSSRWQILPSVISPNQAGSNHASFSSGINHSVLSYAQTSFHPIFGNSTGLKRSYLYWILILGMKHTVHTEGWTNLPLNLQLTHTGHLPFDFALGGELVLRLRSAP